MQTVQDLINQLSQFDPSTPVHMKSVVGSGFGTITLDGGSCEFELEDNYSYYNQDLEEEIEVGPCLVFIHSGDETDHD